MEYESDVGSLGMTVALDWKSEIEERIPPHNFSPMPKINSCYISMEPHGEEWPCDARLVRQMIHLAFDQRRKKLRSTLKNVPRRLGRVKGWHAGRWKQAFAAHLEDERMDLRPDELELDDWIELCSSFSEFVFES
jgi:16S rRNA (adenine1518-N6/adenine1519-N6)-dimethyltransferase